MKSIKPGRGPSRLGMIGGIGAVLFGIFWCILAGAIGAWFMIPFGLIFIGIALSGVFYNHHNATSENRYSIVDIVDEDEETDPLNDKYGKSNSAKKNTNEKEGTSATFCPFCGTSVKSSFDFCPKCGKQLPD